MEFRRSEGHGSLDTCPLNEPLNSSLDSISELEHGDVGDLTPDAQGLLCSSGHSLLQVPLFKVLLEASLNSPGA